MNELFGWMGLIVILGGAGYVVVKIVAAIFENFDQILSLVGLLSIFVIFPIYLLMKKGE